MLSCCVASTWLLESPSNGPVRAGEEPTRTRAGARVLVGAGPTGRLTTAGWNRLDHGSAADDGVLSEEPMMPFDPDVSLSAGLRADEIILRPITAADARLDYEAVMDSRESMRGSGRTSTRSSITGFAGGRWRRGWMRPC